ncbi:MAG: helix-turn-helix domain-containing protein [Chloroflexi bacterium]|nr:helix-turn-helix domain-containing protein [Chloroflexota bacterium]
MAAAPDTVTMKEAARLLGISNAKIWRLVKDGALPAHQNPLDRREKLIRREDVERLHAQAPARRRFVSDGSDMSPVDVPASRIKEWVRETWSRAR